MERHPGLEVRVQILEGTRALGQAWGVFTFRGEQPPGRPSFLADKDTGLCEGRPLPMDSWLSQNPKRYIYGTAVVPQRSQIRRDGPSYHL